MFKNKHRYPFCGMIPDLNTNHDHYITCTFTKQYKTNRLISLKFKLDKFHTPTLLRDIIVTSVDQYYNNVLVDDLLEYTNTPFNHNEIKKCTSLQKNIEWGHFIPGRISKSFHSPLKSYSRLNHLDRRHTSHFWCRSIVPFLWELHHNARKDYCIIIHLPDARNLTTTTVKSTLLSHVQKFILETETLPRHKTLFFSCKASKYNSWSITELKNWLKTTRKILRRFRNRKKVSKCADVDVSSYQLYNNSTQPYQHTVRNHLIITIIRYQK